MYSILYSPGQAPPVKACVNALDVHLLAFTGGAWPGDYGTRERGKQYFKIKTLFDIFGR